MHDDEVHNLSLVCLTLCLPDDGTSIKINQVAWLLSSGSRVHAQHHITAFVRGQAEWWPVQ